MNTPEFLHDLNQRVYQIRQSALQLSSISISQLQTCPAPQKWSALQCIEHLNRHGAFYIGALHQAVSAHQTTSPPKEVQHGWLGKKFTEMLSPEASKPIKTQGKLNPIENQPGIEVITTFLGLQDQLLLALQLAEMANINLRKIPLEFFPLVKLRISDTFQFVIGHEERHLAQAFRAAGLPLTASPTDLLMV